MTPRAGEVAAAIREADDAFDAYHIAAMRKGEAEERATALSGMNEGTDRAIWLAAHDTTKAECEGEMQALRAERDAALGLAKSECDSNDTLREQITTLTQRAEAAEAKFESVRGKIAWHRDGIGPDVPVLQERYDALRRRVVELDAELATLRAAKEQAEAEAAKWKDELDFAPDICDHRPLDEAAVAITMINAVSDHLGIIVDNDTKESLEFAARAICTHFHAAPSVLQPLVREKVWDAINVAVGEVEVHRKVIDAITDAVMQFGTTAQTPEEAVKVLVESGWGDRTTTDDNFRWPGERRVLIAPTPNAEAQP